MRELEIVPSAGNAIVTYAVREGDRPLGFVVKYKAGWAALNIKRRLASAETFRLRRDALEALGR